MATGTSKALTKRSASIALMPPPPPQKKIKRPTTVIDEDKYLDGLSHIIARDFFPGLAATDSTQEYLDALESQDEAWIQHAGQKVREMMTPGLDGRRARGRRGVSMTPLFTETGGETPRGWVGDTPRTTVESEADSELEKEVEVRTDMSLGAFQAKYVSEDNESFNKLLDKSNEAKRRKNAWLWNGNMIHTNGDRIRTAREQKLLEDATSPSASVELVLAEKYRDKRPSMPEWKRSDPKNTLMFMPDSIEDSLQTSAQQAESKSLAPPKSINHGGTRVPLVEDTRPAVPPSPSMSAVDAAIAGQPHFNESEGGYSGAETPRVAGYRFVDAEVQPHERAYMERKGRIESDGQEDQVLRLLGPVENTPNPFTINDESDREKLHRRLVDKANRNRRPQVDRLGAIAGGNLLGGKTPTPRFMSASGISKRPQGNLTPAQQSLLRKVGTPLRKLSAWDDGKEPREKSRLAGVTPRVGR